MRFEVLRDHIIFHFRQEELKLEIKSLFNVLEADYKEGTTRIEHKKIATLNIHEIKKLGLPHVYPYRLEIKTRGTPTTPSFCFETQYFNNKSQRFYQTKRMGVILELDGQAFTLTDPHFSFIESLEKMSPDIKKPGERLSLWSQVIKKVPKECVLENKQLLDFSFVQANQFCLDRKILLGQDFKITPELIWADTNFENLEKTEEGSQIIKDDTLENEEVKHQLPKGISQDFKESFLNTNNVDSYYKVGSYYIQLSEPLKTCLNFIKKINEEPLEKRRAFYMNPMERIKKDLPETISEDLLENIFFETDHFKSDRISHLGKWIPKIGIYIDPENKNPWFPKDDIALKIDDHYFHVSLDDLDNVIKDLEQKQKNGEESLIYKNQTLPVNDKVISKIKKVKSCILEEAKKLSPESNHSKNEKKLNRLVAIIKDNIDTKVYESQINKRSYLEKSIPTELRDKFMKYPHQKEGLSWLQEGFIRGVPGMLLADDMGLGKTFQTLAFLYWYKQKTKDKKPILIVAPTALLENWQFEHQKHLGNYGGLGKKYKAYGYTFRRDRKKSDSWAIQEMKGADWVLTTYEAVRDYHQDFFIKISWGVIVFDEIQKIKNPNSLMTDAGKALASDFSIGLTGTPVENSFIDLWCISDGLYPKILGVLKDFHQRYIKNKASGKEIQDKLSQEQPPFMLRRMKKDVLDNLPEKKVISKEVMMTKEQQDIYLEIIRKMQNGEYSNSLQALSYLNRCSIYNQDCFEGSDKDFIESSAKLKFMFKTLENIRSKQEKALISIENRNLQKKLKGICAVRWNLDVKVINGDLLGENRKRTVDKFNDSEGFNLMIISPKAGGVGLNIVSANHIIHLERWWNPAVEDQCTDRIFRIGQKKPVFVYYPLAYHPKYKEESFDIVLNHLLENKRKMREDTLVVSEPDSDEQKDFYRKVTEGEEMMYFNNKNSFYNSEEWKALRNKVFQKYPAICMSCGNKNHLEVDHVKPRSKYPELELDIDNLQVLCRDCNLLKGVKDDPKWDFREKSNGWLKKD